MMAEEEERVKKEVTELYNEISGKDTEEMWKEDEPLTETEQTIADALEPLGVRSRAEAILSVMSHDDELFGAVLARITWELRNHYEFMCIKECGRRPKKNDADREMGARLDKVASKTMQKVFPEEYKEREMQKLQYELRMAKKGRSE